MKSFFISVFILSTFCIQIIAQDSLRISEKNADYSGLIKVKTTKVSYFNSPKSGGKVCEIQGKKSGFYNFEREHNTAWLEFSAEKTCELQFEITPNSVKDDYDFLLYKCDSSVLPLKFSNFKLPIRSNISRNNEQISGKTGLSSKGDTSYVCFGIGNPYSLLLKVKKGERYVLVIDNVYGTGTGFSLQFEYLNCVADERKFVNERMLNINVIDKKSKKTASAFVKIYLEDSKGKQNDTLFSNTISNCFVKVEGGKNYKILAVQAGYFSQKIDISIDTNQQIKQLTIELDSMYVGRKLVIENLYFNGGSAEILRKSYPTLKQLLQVMKDNPDLKIEIQGHVNDPYNSSQRKTAAYCQELSTARAKAIFDYLAKRGIDKSRMSYQGFGNTQMLFPNATNPIEMEKNRRVEIEILQF